MNDSFNGANLFTELERLQRQMSTLFDGLPSSLRTGRFDAFPRINVGSTDDTLEIVAFAPGLDPAKLEVSVEKGLLVIAGERVTRDGTLPEGTREYAHERFSGTDSRRNSGTPFLAELHGERRLRHLEDRRVAQRRRSTIDAASSGRSQTPANRSCREVKPASSKLGRGASAPHPSAATDASGH